MGLVGRERSTGDGGGGTEATEGGTQAGVAQQCQAKDLPHLQVHACEYNEQLADHLGVKHIHTCGVGPCATKTRGGRGRGRDTAQALSAGDHARIRQRTTPWLGAQRG